MWSESAGFEECAGDVVGEVAEAEGQATQVLEATVHGFGRSVARARPVEVGQDVAGASGQGAAELAQFYQRLRHTVGEGVDHGAHLDAASCPVGVTVGGDHALVDPPGALDVHVPVPSEELVKALVLAVGEQVSPGVQGPPRGVERVALASAVSVQFLLDSAAALIESVPGQPDDVEGIHNRDGVRQLLGGGGLEAREPIHGHDLDPIAPSLVPLGQPVLERLLRPTFDHVQQA